MTMSELFFDEFDNLLSKNKIYSKRIPPTFSEREILPYLRVNNETYVTPEIVEEIVNGMKNNDKTQWNRISVLKSYLEKAIEYFETKHKNKRAWMNMNIWIDEELANSEDESNEDQELDAISLYKVEVEMTETMKKLLRILNESPISKTFGLMKPTEMMAMQSIERQKKLPSEMKYEISEFLGKIPKGGKRRQIRKTRKIHRKSKHFNAKTKKTKQRHNKNTTKTKRKTKRTL